MSITTVQQDISRLEKEIGNMKADHAKKVNEVNVMLDKINKKNDELVKKQAEYKKLTAR